MALFDVQPKSDPHFLYGREKELEAMVDNLKERRWTIILGPRRIGKTSLARCAIAKLKERYVVIDARGDFGLREAIIGTLSTSSGTLQIGSSLNVPHTPIALNIGYAKNFSRKGIDAILDKTKKSVILLDEVQLLKNPRQTVMLLAHIYDYYYDKITFIITGSAIGVMRSILDPGADSPFYGRAIAKLELDRWNPSNSVNFLKEGCREKGLHYDDALGLKVESELDGIPGWLTLFGYNYSLMNSLDGALNGTIDEAVKIVAQEIKNTNEGSLGWPKQLELLQTVYSIPKRFVVIQEETGFNNMALSRNLDVLQRLNYIEKNKDGSYSISDPILKKFIQTKIRKR